MLNNSHQSGCSFGNKMNKTVFKNSTVSFSDLFTVFETTDDRGGRGKNLGKFTSRTLADKAAKGKGWYGSNGAVDVTKSIVIEEQNGAKTAFKLSNMSPIDLEDIYTQEQDDEVSNALNLLNGLNMSKEAKEQLQNQLKNNLR
jgi:hypothetical protein